MRWLKALNVVVLLVFFLVFFLVLCGGVGAQTLETKVAVIEEGVRLLRQDVLEIKQEIIIRSEWEVLCASVNEIKDLVNPKMTKVDEVSTWKNDHIREHIADDRRGELSVTWTLAAFALIVAAMQAGFEVIRRRNGRRSK